MEDVDRAPSSDLAALARALGFSFEELAENRAGRLHPAQRARLESQARAGVVLLRMSVIALVVVLLVTLADLRVYGSGAPEAGALLAGRFVVRGLLLLPLVVLAVVRRVRGRRVARRLASGRVSICEGPIAIRRWRNGKVTVVELAVGEGRVRAGEAAAALVREGAPHRLHLLDGVDFLSIEPIVPSR